MTEQDAQARIAVLEAENVRLKWELTNIAEQAEYEATLTDFNVRGARVWLWVSQKARALLATAPGQGVNDGQ